jgi:serine/threonine protein kinase
MIPPDDSDDEEGTIVRPTGARGSGAMSPSAAIAFPTGGAVPESPAAPAQSAAAPLGHTLPIGTRLRDYEITGLIGEGGFGIVYLAWDLSLQRKVAVKEYVPASIASRVAGSSAIVVKSDRHLDTFKAGLKSFVNEARLLARFDHPSLVKVYRFWEENGTAYMVMPFYEGPTLKTALADLGHVPSEDELRAWLNPLLDALTVMHAAQCFHRDIAPDNILLTASGPLLLDFGAARRVIGDMTHALTVVLKPGYAPIEQYGDVASMSQGAWTDLYALACVVYYAITGKTPMSSVERLMDDRLEPIATLAAGRYNAAFLRAIDAALAVRPHDRPQNEAQFRALLDADRPAAAAPPAPVQPAVHHDAYASTEMHGYSTVPGTLTPVLATQLLARPSGEAAPPLEAAREEPARHAPTAPSTLGPDSTLPGVIVSHGALRGEVPGRGKGWLVVIALVIIGIGIAAAALGVFQASRERGIAVSPSGPASAAPVTEPAPASAIVRPSPERLTAPPAASAVSPPSMALPAASTPAVSAAASSLAMPSAMATPSRETAPIEIPRQSAVVPTPVAVPASSAESEGPAKLPRNPAAVPTPPRGHRENAATRAETPAEPRPEATRRASSGSRCSDILQKASLEPLTAEEAAYLKRECR